MKRHLSPRWRPLGYPYGEWIDAGHPLWRVGQLAPFLVGPTLEITSLTLLAVADDGSLYALQKSAAASGQGVLVRIAEVPAPAVPPALLKNFSVRCWLAEGVATAGVVAPVQGRILARGVGPGLAQFLVPDPLSDPRIQLYQDSALIASNDNWGPELVGIIPAVGAFALTMGSRDAALHQTILGARSITCAASGAPGTSGELLLEIYDSSPSRSGLINGSGLARVSANRPVTFGFAIHGTDPRSFLIRAAGPSLEQFGVANGLADPRIALFRNGVLVTQNDDWSALPDDASRIRPAQSRAGAFAFPSSSRDAALLLTLSAGGYTAIVTGAGAESGEVLVEVYSVPP